MLEPVDVNVYENDELKHWGILGMHWGIRRYQNEDGTLTPEGRERYGVGDAAKIKMLSYSKDYLVLKQKKNRTKKENEKLKRLEEGKKHFEKSVFDEDYWNKLCDNLSNNKLEYATECYTEYFNSTNYGKGMAAAQVMMSIPVEAIAGAAAVGAIYLQESMGASSAFFVLPVGLAASIASNAGAEIYGKNHDDQLKEELKTNKRSRK